MNLIDAPATLVAVQMTADTTVTLRFETALPDMSELSHAIFGAWESLRDVARHGAGAKLAEAGVFGTGTFRAAVWGMPARDREREYASPILRGEVTVHGEVKAAVSPGEDDAPAMVQVTVRLRAPYLAWNTWCGQDVQRGSAYGSPARVLVHVRLWSAPDRSVRLRRRACRAGSQGRPRPDQQVGWRDKALAGSTHRSPRQRVGTSVRGPRPPPAGRPASIQHKGVTAALLRGPGSRGPRRGRATVSHNRIPAEPERCPDCGSIDLCESCEAEAADIRRLEEAGHTPHCARRQAWGDGCCECRVNSPALRVAAHRRRRSQGRARRRPTSRRRRG